MSVELWRPRESELRARLAGLTGFYRDAVVQERVLQGSPEEAVEAIFTRLGSHRWALFNLFFHKTEGETRPFLEYGERIVRSLWLLRWEKHDNRRVEFEHVARSFSLLYALEADEPVLQYADLVRSYHGRTWQRGVFETLEDVAVTTRDVRSFTAALDVATSYASFTRWTKAYNGLFAVAARLERERVGDVADCFQAPSTMRCFFPSVDARRRSYTSNVLLERGLQALGEGLSLDGLVANRVER